MLSNIDASVSMYPKLLIDADNYVSIDLKTTKILLIDTGDCFSIVPKILIDADNYISIGLSTKIILSDTVLR